MAQAECKSRQHQRALQRPQRRRRYAAHLLRCVEIDPQPASPQRSRGRGRPAARRRSLQEGGVVNVRFAVEETGGADNAALVEAIANSSAGWQRSSGGPYDWCNWLLVPQQSMRELLAFNDLQASLNFGHREGARVLSADLSLSAVCLNTLPIIFW